MDRIPIISQSIFQVLALMNTRYSFQRIMGIHFPHFYSLIINLLYFDSNVTIFVGIVAKNGSL